jgi:hypothetical protein
MRQVIQCVGVVRKYSSKTSVIARIPIGIDESSATKFAAWLIPEVEGTAAAPMRAWGDVWPLFKKRESLCWVTDLYFRDVINYMLAVPEPVMIFTRVPSSHFRLPSWESRKT